MSNELMRLSKARTVLFTVPPTTHTLRNWIRDGFNGVKLRAVAVGDKRVTYYISQAFVDEFFQAITDKADKRQDRQKQVQAAHDAVQRMKERGWI